MSRLHGMLRHLTFTFAVLAAGCTPAGTPRDRDATAITFLDPVQDIRLLSSLEIGGGASEIYFFNVQDIAVDDDGFIYVSDRAEDGIRVLRSDGALVRTIGRKGQGPGEFRAPLHVDVARDTVFVHDSGGLLHLFASGGEHLTSMMVGGALATAMKVQAAPGKLIVVGMGDSIDGHWRMSTTMFLRTIDYTTGSASEPVWALPLSEMREIGSRARAPDVGAPYPSIAPTIHGKVFGSAWDAYTIEVRSLEGNVLDRGNAVVPRVRVSDLDLRLAERRIAAVENPKPLRKRKYRAPLGELAADASGNLLIERADLRQDTMRVWDVMKAGWRVVGRLRTPPSFRLLHFAGCNLYGTSQDSLAVPAVVRFRLEPCPLTT